MDTFQQEEKILLKIKRRIVRELNDFTIDDVYESNPCIENDLHMIKFRELEYSGFVNDFIRKYSRILDCEKSYELGTKWINDVNDLSQMVNIHAKQIRNKKEDIASGNVSVNEVVNDSALYQSSNAVNPEFAAHKQPSDGDHATAGHANQHQPSEGDHVTAEHVDLRVLHQPSDGNQVTADYGVVPQASDSVPCDQAYLYQACDGVPAEHVQGHEHVDAADHQACNGVPAEHVQALYYPAGDGHLYQGSDGVTEGLADLYVYQACDSDPTSLAKAISAVVHML